MRVKNISNEKLRNELMLHVHSNIDDKKSCNIMCQDGIGYFCCRKKNHKGSHIATNTRVIIEIWD